MSNHFTKVCEFGKSHGGCRCASPNKTIIKVPCDRPNAHKPKESAVETPGYPAYTPPKIKGTPKPIYEYETLIAYSFHGHHSLSDESNERLAALAEQGYRVVSCVHMSGGNFLYTLERLSEDR